ncbi:LysR substrate-binding domain-containing protein [Erwinia tracheiphila]|uniref:LysR family transcriptional regulator n=1 Tax=Erwinia tracheiphila TaxID=65700 RepID=A0A345CN89_9GAMM|nr:LysR substrate-binding domain-containing protein [Erwinia tracheiphila]AXF74906.1 LysR family transcriptional regulator [Erwinia tracheiphila]UIA82556.1 LysR substrate-binding domain-containing protein [Erwinia tracheiphila]UIA91144.1 LysR substrate-binding domain-containing protein [Erwinia tracheiphila]
MSLPPLYALRAFEAAARLGSFSKAGDLLNVTPGAISRHIRTLEAWFDCELFRRNGPRIVVTDAGRVLADHLTEGFFCIERACLAFRSNSHNLRLKAPSTLTMRWLLDVLNAFRESHPTPRIEITSVWMDTDVVDFSFEPYDCAILLGNGNFGEATASSLLFDEWLIPVCAPRLKTAAQTNLAECELIHPSPDRRDWRRWLKKTASNPGLDLSGGKVFDTLEQGNLAAISGHGISVGDLLLSLEAINSGLLSLPFEEAVATGDGYYLVWPANSPRIKNIELLYDWLKKSAPTLPQRNLVYRR